MSLSNCPVSGSAEEQGPISRSSSASQARRECTLSEANYAPDVHVTDLNGSNIPDMHRGQTSINEFVYDNYNSRNEASLLENHPEPYAMNASDSELVDITLGAPARQMMRRAEEIGPQTGWRDGYLSTENGLCPPDYEEPIRAIARSPGRIWSDLCERMPGCSARGAVREAVAALPLVEATEENIPDKALSGALVALGMLCSVYRFEDQHDENDGAAGIQCAMGDDLCEELQGIPLCIALPYHQISRRMGIAVPDVTFPGQSSYNLKIRDNKANGPYLARFDNTDLRWPMFGGKAEVAFLKGCADTSASFQHGPDAIAACQEHVMTGNVEGLLYEMVRLKEILGSMTNALHSLLISPSTGDNQSLADEWIRWGLLSKQCPLAFRLNFAPCLIMDAFLGRRLYTSDLGAKALHDRENLPSHHRAFVAAIQNHYSIPEFVQRSHDPRLMGVLDGIIEAYAGERGFLGVHRTKVCGILDAATKTRRSITDSVAGAADATVTHHQLSEAMKERLEPFRIESHSIAGTFEECKYMAKVSNCSAIDKDPDRSTALVTLDIRDTGMTFMPGDRVAVMPLNTWEECAKIVAALGLDEYMREPIQTTGSWSRFSHHLSSVTRTTHRQLTVMDILRRGHLAPITKELTVKVHELLHASSNTVLQVLATDEWPVRGSLGDLLQNAITDTPSQIWDKAFSLDNLDWLPNLVQVEVPRTYFVSSYSKEVLPTTVDLTISRAEYKVSSIFSQGQNITRAGVSSGFLNQLTLAKNTNLSDQVLLGVSRSTAFQVPVDNMAPCAFFAEGSGIAPFRSFLQHRLATSSLSGGRNLLYLEVKSRDNFCYEGELRKLVKAGFMEVHLALSKDSRGLSYDHVLGDLVDKKTPPRHIDSLIIEQASTVCEMIMSKEQGGLGGYLYVCGSVSTFESVMKGLRKALNNCTARVEPVDLIINEALAERRLMLDLFTSPKALPCNLPTISISNLAMHTGHQQGSRMWIAVHGSVYDVTDYYQMHPGGSLAIKSNAGIDCTESFDSLGHANNSEALSLLTRYFVGHLSPTPDYRDRDVSTVHRLWSSYLRVTVETLVAHQCQIENILGVSLESPSTHGPSLTAIKAFQKYQSHILTDGFTSLFGSKFEELVLRLSFSFASASEPGAVKKLPDILGTVSRAKASPDADFRKEELSALGDCIYDASSRERLQERGVVFYVQKCAQLDIELLEHVRQEACNGMDAFESIDTVLDSLSSVSPDSETPVAALSLFLLQILERMAHRLAIFYAQLAPLSVYQQELERITALSDKMEQELHFETETLRVNNHTPSPPAEQPQKTAQPTAVSTAHRQTDSTFVNETAATSATSRRDLAPVEKMQRVLDRHERTEIRDLTSIYMPSPYQALYKTTHTFATSTLTTAPVERLESLPNLEDQRKRLAEMASNYIPSPYQLPYMQELRAKRRSSLYAAKAQELAVHKRKMSEHDSIPSFASGTSGSTRCSSLTAYSSTDSSAGSPSLSPVLEGPQVPPSDPNTVPDLNLTGLNRRQRTQSTSSKQSFISAFETKESRRNSSALNTINAAKRRSIYYNHTREPSAGKLLQFKLGALAEQRRSFFG
ncbi:hypothetical protein F53441_13087 [Fusarium austroafricanum]|uniref:NADPH--hemoprotein reductase n=1 Tax=Fusarium austroafricanum TaxID=2364996 RepID=A0A8H4NGT3_9HYPO|nr:hypothetical protein F53441_13087 [Fusarium austroafricanum]